MTERSPQGQGSFLTGGGEMGALMRSFDWSKTPLGDTSHWSQSLKALVKMLLTSSYPMVLTWGEDFTQFYNDAYSQLIGDKHPAALGSDIRITLAEAWDTLGPMIQRVMTTGVANWTPALLLVLERSSYREESYFSVSHAPAEDDRGQIVGMLAVCSEVKQQILGDRRLRLLRDLASKAGETRSVEATCHDLMAAIAAHPLDVPFALLYLHDPNSNTLTLQGAVGLAVDTPLSPHLVDLTEQSTEIWSLVEAATGDTVLVEAVDRYQSVPGGPWNEPVHSALVMPIASSGQAATLGVLVAGVNPNRALDESYRSFYELFVGQVSVSLRNAQAHEEERHRVETLAALDRAKTTFFNNISHEFRTPLTLMLAPVEDVLTHQDATLTAEAREQLQMVQRNGLRLQKLVNTLLDFSRLEAGRMQANYEPTDLAAYATELASVFRSTVEQAGLRLVVDCPPLPEPIYVDRAMWEKIVLNLLSNAFKFTFEGELSVSLHPVEHAIKLVIKDTGIGISADELPQLFERFHRVKGAHGRTYEGSGIGLSLVQELVKLHGGTVTVSSVVGEGSTFVVSVPTGCTHLPPDRVQTTQVQTTQAQSTTASSATAYVQEALGWLPEDYPTPYSLPPTPSSARILLADDNADMRRYLQRLLKEHYEVEAVADGRAALEAVRARIPDLVLTDIMMPGVDGFALLKALRANSQTREVPILLLSARAGEEAAVEGLAAGADDYLVKPFSGRELLARVRANLELGRSRQETARHRIENILESMTDGFVALDRQWRYIYANQEAEALLQKPQTELLGQVIWEISPELAGSELEAGLHQAVEQQVTVELDGYYAPLNVWFEVRVYPTPEGLSIYFRNLTERKQAEIALRESEDRLRLAIESAELGTWDYSPATGLLRWDEHCKTMFGLPPDATVSYEVFLAGLHPDDRGQTDTVVQWALNSTSGGKYDIEFRTIGLEDGIERWVAAKGQAYFNAAGNAIRFIGTVLNITEKKRAEAEREQLFAREQAAREQAETANRLKDEFLAVLSHELRTPLNPILGWSRLLRSGNLDAAKAAYALETIEHNAKLQTQLIEDLLDVSRILQGKLSLNIAPVDLVATIAAAQETVRLAAEAKAIEVRCEVRGVRSEEVMGDSNRLQQVMWNLLSNAVKFTPSGGQVEVTLEQIPSYAQIQVKDTGIGISPEFLPHVFSYFRQEDATTTRKFGGLGLGLAIVRQIVELHGGTVHARNRREGQGTTFTVRLPLLRNEIRDEIRDDSGGMRDGSNPPSSLIPHPSSLPLNGIRVLIVDDDSDARELIVFVLEQAGAVTESVATGNDALERFKQFQPDVLLSDIGMAEMDGYMLIQQVRLLSPEQGGAIPAIALTAYAGDVNERQAHLAGFHKHLAKPVEPNHLVQAIVALLGDVRA